MLLRCVAVVSTVVFAACPNPPPDVPPGPPLNELPDPRPPARTPIIPSFIEHSEGCPDRLDNDGDGVFEEVRNVTVDPDHALILRRTQRIDGRGFFSQVFLPLDDGLTHDDEQFATDGDFLPVQYGNAHSNYDDDGRLIHERLEGSDARIPILDRVYSYDGDLLVAIDTEALVNDLASDLTEFDYDDEERLVERRVDVGKDGFEQVSTFSYAEQLDGVIATTVVTESAGGTRIDVQTFDPFNVLLHREIDEDGDGDVDVVFAVDVVDGQLEGYDIDPDGDGPDGFTVRLDYGIDPVEERLTVTTRQDGVVRRVVESDYSCYAPVDRGGCEAPFVDSAAFGCARFRFAPAMEKARGEPVVAPVGDAGFIAAGGFSSFPLGPFYSVYDVVDVDGEDAQVVAFSADAGLMCGVDNGDGSATVYSGMRNGVVGSGMNRLSASGVEVAGSVNPRRGGQAVRMGEDTVFLMGGFNEEGVLADAQVVHGAGAGFTSSFALAPLNGTLTRVGNVAFYVGGDDGEVEATPSPLAVALGNDGVIGLLEAELPAPLTQHAALAIDDERLLIIGGRTPSGVTRDVWIGRLDIDFDIGTIALVFDEAVDLPVALRAPAAVMLDDGRVLVAGGFDSDGEPSALTFVFDGAAWLVGPPLNIPRGQARAIRLNDGRFAIVGGSLHFGSATAAVEVLELP
ncbi:MAG: hypothetical protein Q8O67_32675 [Deltaproteobacteria bacterium]|nr:hypothetical protein [Deltaproteobacteria bacterium]